ncbi:histidine kinase [Paenibacillus sp. GCM10012307]|uniref:histidine kinase n=1 Tax=Paenibacillus roseus TaxID=2798579 RepID=A0A934J0C1_9BACL|nr:sensor histidine kinase [Paenibacillus roseus]MBJ6362507.1 sensor histidine kinase [Paenibacillus roseus]
MDNRSIRVKLLFYFVIIILLSILSLGFLGSYLYKNSIEEEMGSHTIQMMNQVKDYIESNLKEMDHIIAYLSIENELIDFLKADGREVARIADLGDQVRNRLAIYERERPEIAGILAVGQNSAFASNTIERIERNPLTDEEWYQIAVKYPDKLHLFSHPIGRNIRVNQNLSVDQVLSVAKAVRDQISGEVIGVLLIDMKLDFIRSIVESVSLGKSGFIFIVEETGGVVYSPANHIVYRISSDWLKEKTGSLIKPIFGLDYRIIYNTFENNGWRIVGVVPLNESLKVVSDLQLSMVIIALITLFLAFIASTFFTNSIVRPVAKLRSLMRKVEEGELHLRFRSKRNDEIGQLGNSFNKMVEEIENLINLVYMEQKAKREAELKALQAQIKPHFLYNTLDTIHWMAQDRDAQDIVEIIVALTNLLRIGLSKGNEIIPITHELQHVESYLVIQMARYEDKLAYEIFVSDDVKGCRVLKIILQPLVENAIYHGIKTKQGPGKIMIRCFREGDNLLLTVEDDGAGIPEDKLALLRESIQSVKAVDGNQGYGLLNVNERIKLSYGSAYGISVHSELGKGTVTIAQLPFSGT